MIEEKNFLEKKARKLKENVKQEEALHIKQEQFLQLIQDRYKEACTSTKSLPEVEVSKDNGTGIYSTKAINKPERKQKDEDFVLENPEKMSEIKTAEQFKLLKERVILAVKTDRVNRKGYTLAHTKSVMDDKRDSQALAKLTQILQEEDKLYEHLVERIEKIHKELPQKRKLAPLSAVTVSQAGMSDNSLLMGQSQLFDSRLNKSLQPKIVNEMKKLVDLKKLEEDGSILIKGGICDDYIIGDKEILRGNLKSKLVRLVFWYSRLYSGFKRTESSVCKETTVPLCTEP